MKFRNVLVGAALWAALALAALVGMTMVGPGGFVWWRLPTGLVLLAWAITVRRRFPLAALLVVAGAVLLDTLAENVVSGAYDLTISYLPALAVLAYLVGRRMPDARPASAAFAGVLLVAIPLTIGPAGFAEGVAYWVRVVVLLLMTWTFPWLVGRYWRQHLALAAAGWQRAEHLEREQRITADRARSRERARIAQDMHDSLGHRLSIIAIRSGALQVATGLDERHRVDAAELRSEVAGAARQLRDIIGVLREDAEESGHEEVGALVDRTAATGVSVRVHEEGERVTLAPLVERAAYRVVQEALTNAVKHAPGATIEIMFGYAADDVRIEVLNEPPADAPAADRVSGGQGLSGLRERVRLSGGTLHTGPRDGGYAVTARLPYRSDAPGAHPDGDPPSGMPVTGPTDRLHRSQRQTRRRLVTAVLTPVVGLVTISVFYYVFQTFGTTVRPMDFARISVGQSRADIANVLPDRQLPDRPAAQAPPVPTAAAGCAYYTDGRALSGRFLTGSVYRLCFLDGRVVSKDVY